MHRDYISEDIHKKFLAKKKHKRSTDEEVKVLQDRNHEDITAKHHTLHESFNFSRADGIFAAFLDCWKEQGQWDYKQLTELEQFTLRRCFPRYIFNKLEYLATVEVEWSSPPHGLSKPSLMIRLANDGFQYRNADEFSYLKSEHFLPKENIMFPSVKKFVNEWFPQLMRPTHECFYSSRDAIMGIKFVTPDVSLVLCFEPGFPTEEFDDK